MQSISKRILAAAGAATFVAAIAIAAEPPHPLKTTAGGLKQFGFTLFQTMKNDKDLKEPVAISPLSIAEAMTLVTNGAEGETLAELERLFLTEEERKAGADIKLLTKGITDLRKSLTDYAKSSDGAFVFSSANSLWANSNKSVAFQFKPEFLKLAKASYNAETRDRDFEDKATVVEINKWVDTETKTKIKDIISELKREDVAVLVNAIYAKGKFLNPFHSIRVGKYKKDGKEADVSYLSSQGSLAHFKDAKVQAFSLPIGKRGDFGKNAPEVALDILVPADGDLRALANAIDGKYYSEVVAGLKSKMIALQLPAGRVQMKAAAKLGPYFQAAPFDVKTAFHEKKAKFGLLGSVIDERNLYISDVVTKTFYEVTPFGFEAAAATAVLVAGATSVPQYEDIRVTTPSLHVVRHVATGTPLFIVEYDSPLQYTEDELVAFVEEGFKSKNGLSAEFKGDTISVNYGEKGEITIALTHFDKDTQKYSVVKVYKTLVAAKK